MDEPTGTLLCGGQDNIRGARMVHGRKGFAAPFADHGNQMHDRVGSCCGPQERVLMPNISGDIDDGCVDRLRAPTRVNQAPDLMARPCQPPNNAGTKKARRAGNKNVH
jgi:hypothetical protein